jgi:transposase
VAKGLGVAGQTIDNWVKADVAGRLQGVTDKPFSAEQMEIARLKAELARARMERDILKKAAAYFAKESL